MIYNIQDLVCVVLCASIDIIYWWYDFSSIIASVYFLDLLLFQFDDFVQD